MHFQQHKARTRSLLSGNGSLSRLDLDNLEKPFRAGSLRPQTGKKMDRKVAKQEEIDEFGDENDDFIDEGRCVFTVLHLRGLLWRRHTRNPQVSAWTLTRSKTLNTPLIRHLSTRPGEAESEKRKRRQDRHRLLERRRRERTQQLLIDIQVLSGFAKQV